MLRRAALLPAPPWQCETRQDGNPANVLSPPEVEASRAMLNLQVLSSFTSHTALFPLQICPRIPLCP